MKRIILLSSFFSFSLLALESLKIDAEFFNEEIFFYPEKKDPFMGRVQTKTDLQGLCEGSFQWQFLEQRLVIKFENECEVLNMVIWLTPAVWENLAKVKVSRAFIERPTLFDPIIARIEVGR